MLKPNYARPINKRMKPAITAKQPGFVKTKIGIIESNRLLREHLSASISSESDMKVIFSLSCLDPHLMPEAADIIISRWADIRQPLIHHHNGDRIHSKLLIIEADSLQIDIARCIRSGVTGFALKDSPIKELIASIRSVMAGNWAVPAPVAITLFNQLAEKAKPAHYSTLPFDEKLTGRERQIIPLILNGMTNKEIAAKLNIAVDTVKAHVHNILNKFAIRGRIDLVNHVCLTSDAITNQLICE
jgi:DNA-binding NarL/FixJ family response regulator